MPLIEAYARSRIKAVRGQTLERMSLSIDTPTMLSFKTVGTFTRALKKAVLDFYRGNMDAVEFTGIMSDLIEKQFSIAWEKGAEDVGFNPRGQSRFDRDELQQHIDSEARHVVEFAQAVILARVEEKDVKPLYARVDLWANRFNQVENDARLYFAQQIEQMPAEEEGDGLLPILPLLPALPALPPLPGLPVLPLLGGAIAGELIHLVWRLGRTEQHCSTCFALNGTVASATDWVISGIRPQAAPNARLECGGWRCDCSLDVTDEPLSAGGVPAV